MWGREKMDIGKWINKIYSGGYHDQRIYNGNFLCDRTWGFYSCRYHNANKISQAGVEKAEEANRISKEANNTAARSLEVSK